MQDLQGIAKEMIKEKIDDKLQEIEKAKSNIQEVESFELTRKNKEYYFSIILNNVDRFKNLDLDGTKYSTTLEIYDRLSLNKFEIHKRVKNAANQSDFMDQFKNSRSDLKSYLSLKTQYDKTYGFITTHFGENMISNIDQIIAQLMREKKHLEDVELFELRSQAYEDKLVSEIAAERKKLKAGAASFNDTVKMFTDTNYLLDELAEKTKTIKELMEDAIKLSNSQTAKIDLLLPSTPIFKNLSLPFAIG